jgi:hypothetical protein
LALKGKLDFLRKTNPWRSKEDIENEKLDNLMQRQPDRAGAAKTIAAWAKAVGVKSR